MLCVFVYVGKGEGVCARECMCVYAGVGGWGCVRVCERERETGKRVEIVCVLIFDPHFP